VDLSGIAVEDAAPLMRDIEAALSNKRVERITFRDDNNQGFLATLSRPQAEHLLQQLEAKFFATVN